MNITWHFITANEVEKSTYSFLGNMSCVCTGFKVACEQAHLIGKGGGATIASRRSRREEWGEEK